MLSVRVGLSKLARATRGFEILGLENVVRRPVRVFDR